MHILKRLCHQSPPETIERTPHEQRDDRLSKCYDKAYVWRLSRRESIIMFNNYSVAFYENEDLTGHYINIYVRAETSTLALISACRQVEWLVDKGLTFYPSPPYEISN